MRDLDRHLIGSHIQKAHRSTRGEHQLSQYVAQLSLNECVEILAVSNISLASLASRHPECRVLPDEQRSFKKVIKTWALYILSGIEDG